MNGPFTAADEQFRAGVRAFVRRELQPQAERWERRASLSRRALAACARQGWLSLAPPRQAILAEELPRCDSLGFALSVFVQANLIAPILRELASPEQRQAWLDPLLAGRAIGALAVSEPEAGSDVAAIRTTARGRRGELVVDGVKTYITNGAAADVLIVAVRTDGEGASGLSLVLVPASAPGVQVQTIRTLGLETSAMGRLTFSGCRVPVANLLGRRGAGFGYVLQALDRERLFGGLAAVAWAQYALERTIAWTKRRHAFGRPLARLQVVRHQLADATIQLEAARQLNYATFSRWLEGRAMTREIAMIKVFSYQAAQQAIERCLQLHGGAGYVADAWISRFYRDARALTIAAGTPEVMKDLVAAHLRL